MVLVHEFGTSADQKDVISRSALKYATVKSIPLNRRFSTRQRETSARSAFDLRPFAHKGQFSELSATSLLPVKRADKLYIFAHADPQEVGFAHARLLASLLFANGLREAGLITFKACEVGLGNLLESFVDALVAKGVVLGWVKAYNGSASTASYVDTTTGALAQVREEITVERVSRRTGRVRDYTLRGDARVRIVRSPNNPFTYSFGRYTVTQDSEDFLALIDID